MDTAAVPQTMTFEEFLALPEGPPNYEFEQGVVVPVASPSGPHQDVLGNLFIALKAYLRENPAGRVWMNLDVFLPQRRVYVPDLVYLREQNLARYQHAGDRKIHGVPDLVLEIISPGGERRDRLKKFNAYLEAGVPWYWMIDSESLVIEEFHLGPAGYTRSAAAGPGEVFRPQAFPGLEIPVDGLRD